MLIRSQNKLDLVKLDDLNIEVNKDGTASIFMYHHEAHFNISAYSSKEKAIKVLDMIQGFYGNLKYIECYGLDFVCPVFQMPKDNEVEI